ncbi:hypothetical protein ACLB1M_03405 [Escherichia coli]
MLILISPAKTLDYQSPFIDYALYAAGAVRQFQQLIHEARKLTPPQISTLMCISNWRVSTPLAFMTGARFHAGECPPGDSGV